MIGRQMCRRREVDVSIRIGTGNGLIDGRDPGAVAELRPGSSGRVRFGKGRGAGRFQRPDVDGQPLFVPQAAALDREVNRTTMGRGFRGSPYLRRGVVTPHRQSCKKGKQSSDCEEDQSGVEPKPLFLDGSVQPKDPGQNRQQGNAVGQPAEQRVVADHAPYHTPGNAKRRDDRANARNGGEQKGGNPVLANFGFCGLERLFEVGHIVRSGRRPTDVSITLYRSRRLVQCLLLPQRGP